MSRGARECLRYLASLDSAGGSVFPLQRTIAKRLGCDVRSVKRYVRELRKAGCIVIQRRGRTSAIYEIQKGQFVPSSVPSSVPSGRRYKEVCLVSPERKPPCQELNFIIPEMQAAYEEELRRLGVSV